MFRIAAAFFLLASAPSSPVASYPFAPGERVEYDIRIGPIKSGQATMALDTATIASMPVWNARLRIAGGIPFYRVDDRYSSHFAPETFTSVRYEKSIHEGSRKKHEVLTFRGETVVSSTGKILAPVVSPLDDASLLYFVRTLPLAPGKTVVSRYFRANRNPVTIEVLRREVLRTSVGPVRAIVVKPYMVNMASGARTFFSAEANTRIWISDDDRRVILRLESSLPVGRLVMEMRSFTRGTRQGSSGQGL